MENQTEPAFPNDTFYGLTKRQYFAGLAMHGILANPQNSHNDLFGINGNNENGFMSAEMVAREAVSYADELLKALETK